MVTPPIRRTDADACPGALRLHTAADGLLARVRIPGGLLTGTQLRALRELAERWGDGRLEITSRANLQLRALRASSAAPLAAALSAAGLLPSETHEVVRNIAASPTTPPSARHRVTELDRALCADPVLASLPGRFLFALDDGTGDVIGAADVAAVPLGGDTSAVLFAGTDTGLRVPSADIVATLLAAAHAFLTERRGQSASRVREPADGPTRAGQPASRVRDPAEAPPRAGQSAWRVRELTDGPMRVGRRTAAELGIALGAPDFGPSRRPARELAGLVEQADGLVAAGAPVPFGTLSGVPLKLLEEAGLVVLTAARGVLVPDLPPEAAREWLARLAGAGLDVEPGSRWSGVTACAGRPGCAKALADVRQDAAASAAPPGAALLAVHWVGCGRGCGSPGGRHVRVEAVAGGGYLVGGGTQRVAAADIGPAVAAARRI